MPSLLALARMAVDDLVGLAKRGELEPEHLWTACKGAGTYLAALAQGRARLDPVRAKARARICVRYCSRRTSETAVINGDKVVKWYCGPVFEEHDNGPGARTCGCLVALTVTIKGRREITPAGKTVLNGERCPSGEW